MNDFIKGINEHYERDKFPTDDYRFEDSHKYMNIRSKIALTLGRLDATKVNKISKKEVIEIIENLLVI